MWETVDPDGRRVVLTAERWEHVLDSHAVLENNREDVLIAVSRPTQRVMGRRRGEEFFYLTEVGPSRLIKVVVHYEHGEGRVVTAFPRRRFP